MKNLLNFFFLYSHDHILSINRFHCFSSFLLFAMPQTFVAPKPIIWRAEKSRKRWGIDFERSNSKWLYHRWFFTNSTWRYFSFFHFSMQSTTMTCSARSCHNYSSTLAAVFKLALNQSVFWWSLKFHWTAWHILWQKGCFKIGNECCWV